MTTFTVNETNVISIFVARKSWKRGEIGSRKCLLNIRAKSLAGSNPVVSVGQ
jgi:hypothetical protein